MAQIPVCLLLMKIKKLNDKECYPVHSKRANTLQVKYVLLFVSPVIMLKLLQNLLVKVKKRVAKLPGDKHSKSRKRLILHVDKAQDSNSSQKVRLKPAHQVPSRQSKPLAVDDFKDVSQNDSNFESREPGLLLQPCICPYLFRLYLNSLEPLFIITCFSYSHVNDFTC